MMEPLGQCNYCEGDGVIKINEIVGCVDHITEATEEGMAALRAFRKTVER